MTPYHLVKKDHRSTDSSQTSRTVSLCTTSATGPQPSVSENMTSYHLVKMTIRVQTVAKPAVQYPPVQPPPPVNNPPPAKT